MSHQALREGTDLQAINGRGLLIRTFGDRKIARRWVVQNAALHDGLRLEEVTVSVVRRRLFTPRVVPAVFAPVDTDLTIPDFVRAG